MTAATAHQPRPGRVMIIDDDHDVAEGIRLLLEDDGMVVDVRHSLITVPLTIRKFDPDVVLLDLSMPGLSGSAYFAAGAHKFIDAGVPVILFSGRTADELSRLTEELGADGFISKAQDALDVTWRVRTWVKHRRALQRAARKVTDATRTASSASNEQRTVGSGDRSA